MTHTDPRAAVDALAAAREPYLIGVRHHSPALAAVVPALLDASGADVVCVELPADFQPWLEHLADPETVAPVALAGAGQGGRLAFYPFADFSPELAAIRWAASHGATVLCCDLPLSDRGWTDEAPAQAAHTGTADGAPGTPGAAGTRTSSDAAAHQTHTKHGYQSFKGTPMGIPSRSRLVACSSMRARRSSRSSGVISISSWIVFATAPGENGFVK